MLPVGEQAVSDSESASSSRSTRSRTGSFSCSATLRRCRSGPPSSAASGRADLSHTGAPESGGDLAGAPPLRLLLRLRLGLLLGLQILLGLPPNPSHSASVSNGSSSATPSASSPSRARGSSSSGASNGSASLGRRWSPTASLSLALSSSVSSRTSSRSGGPGRRSRPRCPRAAARPPRRCAWPGPGRLRSCRARPRRPQASVGRVLVGLGARLLGVGVGLGWIFFE